MPQQQPKFSEPRQCGHCGNHATMEVVAEFKDLSIADYDNFPFREGECYKLLKCPACKKVELQSYSHCEACDEGPNFNYQTIYPAPLIAPLGLPKQVQKEYLAATKEKGHSPNAYGVLMGRVLELVCEDKKAKGKMLGQQIKDLAERKLFPPQLATVAFRQNALRVLGAHAKAGNLTAKEVPIIGDLTRAILEYVYSTPYLISQAEKALKKLNRHKRCSPKNSNT